MIISSFQPKFLWELIVCSLVDYNSLISGVMASILAHPVND